MDEEGGMGRRIETSGRSDLLAIISSPLRAMGQRYGSLPRSSSVDCLATRPVPLPTSSFPGELKQQSSPTPPPSPEWVRGSAAYTAVMERASQLLPAGFGRKRSTPEPPTPPPIHVAVRRRGGGYSWLEMAPGISLESLLGAAAKVAGSTPDCFSLVVEEERGPPGVKELLRSTANRLAHRRRLAWTVLDNFNWLVLPESLTREVRGRGLLAWAEENIGVHLREPSGSDAIKVTVELASDRRVAFVASPDDSLAKLRASVAARAGIQPDRQRLLLRERRAQTPGEAAAWAALRAAIAWLSVLLHCLGLALGLVDPAADAPVTLHLTTRSGRSVRLDVTRDLTLHQVSQLALSQHGEELDLAGLTLAPRDGALRGARAGLQAGPAVLSRPWKGGC
uniref:Ubiquitin-like domain-containing protein n=1 Tax=Auxenochlorella protothecoides TaxID=3075 RepID=A0A1D2AD86_AUXPR